MLVPECPRLQYEDTHKLEHKRTAGAYLRPPWQEIPADLHVGRHDVEFESTQV